MARLRWRHVGFGSLVCATALGIAARSAGAASLPAEIVSCGQSVTHSLRVANNLEDCADDGLVVGADNVTIDLGGHRLDGDGSGGGGVGIRNDAHVGVTVRNGTITGFSFGVHYGANAQGLVVGVLAVENVVGISVGDFAAKSIVKNNLASRNNTGIRISGETATVVQDNVVVGNTGRGVLLDNAKGVTLSKNRISGNDGNGIEVEGRDNVIQKNTVTGNGTVGISLNGAQSVLLKRNVVSGNGQTGIVFSGATNNTLQANVVSGNDEDGIIVGTSTGNVLKSNVVSENGLHGIASDTGDLTLEGNRADRNGFLGGGPGDDTGAGIAVAAGTTNEKNKATGNDDPHECVPSDLGCFVVVP